MYLQLTINVRTILPGAADPRVSARHGLAAPFTRTNSHGHSPRLAPFLSRFEQVIDEDRDEGSTEAVGCCRGALSS